MGRDIRKIAIVYSWYPDVKRGTGTATYFNTLVNGLTRRGYSVEIVSPEHEPSGDYIKIALDRFLFNSRLAIDPRIQSADLVITFDFDGFALDPVRRPLMLNTVHTLFAEVLPWETGEIKGFVKAQAYFSEASMNTADKVIIGSSHGKNRIIDRYDVSAEKIIVLPHGNPSPMWLPKLKPKANRSNKHPVILSVCGMYPGKRIDLLVEATAELIKTYPDLELRLVGSGMTYDALQTQVDELGLRNNVDFIGSLGSDDASEFARHWSEADVFVHPSAQETFGFVYLEAMMAGKAIVAMNASSTPEVLGDAAILAEPGQSKGLIDGIGSLLASTELRHSYEQKAKERSEQFNQERMLDGYEHIFAGLN